MTWKSDAKTVNQAHYGGYKEMCKELKIETVPYHQFNDDIYYTVRQQYKLYKKSK